VARAEPTGRQPNHQTRVVAPYCRRSIRQRKTVTPGAKSAGMPLPIGTRSRPPSRLCKREPEAARIQICRTGPQSGQGSRQAFGLNPPPATKAFPHKPFDRLRFDSKAAPRLRSQRIRCANLGEAARSPSRCDAVRPALRQRSKIKPPAARPLV